MSRQKLVAGNWKMNGSKAATRLLIGEILQGITKVKTAEVVVCPPNLYLAEAAALLAGSRIALGAQNLCAEVEAAGAYTGEVSAAMLLDVGCRYVIVGHSERRAYYGESDAVVAQKCVRALDVGLKPIVCVGELLEEREGGRTEAVVARQLDAVLAKLAVTRLAGALIAYEPVWAIGTGKTATPEQAQVVHAFIRGRIAAHNATIAGSIQILYGGSVKGANARDLFNMADIDGGLIGGASLNADEFLTICQAAG
ncbi:MAG TPA: triose-phosphate isomerase [Gammaproteobacteria bacterium]|nr:triose-phosphate isomerase [Gammaproteobacteria bacterium]